MPGTIPNLALAIYSAIADGIVGDTDSPFKAFNVIRYDTVRGIQDPEKLSTGDGDYPQITIVGPVSGSTDLRTGNETFGTYAPENAVGEACDWLETSEYVYKLTVKSDLLDMNETSQQTTLAVNAIRKLGPRLGLAYVTGIKLKFTERDVQNPDQGEMKRVETELVLTVNCQNEGMTLTGD